MGECNEQLKSWTYSGTRKGPNPSTKNHEKGEVAFAMILW